MSELGGLIAAEFADWEGPRYLEEEIFGTGDPDRIATGVDRFCLRALESSIERYELFAASVMSVHGVRLDDGRRVVVKIGRRSVGAKFLSAVRVVQAQLFSQGFPCPRPLLGPTPVGAGIAVVEELLDRGVRRCAHDAAAPRSQASGVRPGGTLASWARVALRVRRSRPIATARDRLAAMKQANA